MMQVNFRLTPALAAMIRQSLDMPSVVLLRRIEIRVTEGASVVISETVDELRVFPAPFFQAALLLIVGSARAPVPGHNRRFEVVGESEDQVY